MLSTGFIPQWTLADRLRKAREQIGLDQTEFADRLGVSRSSVSNYERGTTAPRRIVLNAWAMATGVPIEWLRDGSTNPRPGDPDGGVRLPRLDSNQQPSGYPFSQVTRLSDRRRRSDGTPLRKVSGL